MTSPLRPRVAIELPAWIDRHIEEGSVFADDAERMRFVIGLARENIQRDGGPFAAAIFERDSGRLVSVGVNLVVPLANSALHAEVVAVMMAQARIGSYTLAGPDLPTHELFTSCEPCAMCLGAVLWSGAKRLVCGATRDDAQAVHFDEGPVFEQSYDYLAERGIDIVRGVERAAAAAVLRAYASRGGPIYNA